MSDKVKKNEQNSPAASAVSPNKPQTPAPSTGKVGKKSFNYDWLCAAVFLAVTTVMFSSFIFSDKVLGTEMSDQMSSVDMKQAMTDGLVTHRQIPTWFGSRLGGMPSIDAMFSDALYPITTVIRPFVPAHRLFGWTMAVHVFLAGLFFYFMLRRSFGMSRVIAFAGATFYMMSPQFVSHVFPGHDGKMFVIAWLPFVVWRLRSLMYLPTLRNACVMAIGIAMMVLSPHVQMTYFVLMGLFLYWATDVVKSVVDKEDKKRVAFKVLFFWGAVFIGLGLSFAQLWPSYMFVREAFSVRGVDRGFEFAASWSMNWAEFFSLWVHEFGNALEDYWGKNYFKLNTEYAGMIPLLLTALALASKPKNVWRIFWAAVAVMATLFSMGANTPFFTAAYHLIPGVSRFRAPSMIMFWFTFSTSLMAVFFIKDIMSKRFDGLSAELKKKWSTGLLVALGCVTLAAAVFSSQSVVKNFALSMMGVNTLRVFEANHAKNFVPNLWLWWFFVSVTLGMLIAVVNGKLKPVVLVYALIVMGVIDTAKVNSQFIKTESPRKYFYQNDPTLSELRKSMDAAPFRVFSLPGTFALRNQEGVYGLEGVGGFHDNELICYRNFRGEGDIHYIGDIALGGALSEARIRGNTPFLDIANVEYIIGSAGMGRFGKIKNPTALGRLSYAPDFVVLPRDTVVRDTIIDGKAVKDTTVSDKTIEMIKTSPYSYDYRTTVTLLERPELPFSYQKDAGGVQDGVDDDSIDKDSIDGRSDGPITQTANASAPKLLKVEWKTYTPNKRVAKVTMPDNGFLRISEVYYPGWKITANGEAVKYYQSDMAWMAVPLKAGDYEIVMEPKSLYLDNALKVSIVFTVLVAVIFGVGVVMGRRRK